MQFYWTTLLDYYFDKSCFKFSSLSNRYKLIYLIFQIWFNFRTLNLVCLFSLEYYHVVVGDINLILHKHCTPRQVMIKYTHTINTKHFQQYYYLHFRQCLLSIKILSKSIFMNFIENFLIYLRNITTRQDICKWNIKRIIYHAEHG